MVPSLCRCRSWFLSSLRLLVVVDAGSVVDVKADVDVVDCSTVVVTAVGDGSVVISPLHLASPETQFEHPWSKNRTNGAQITDWIEL